jgi:anti-anti-sigma factor
MKRNDPVPAPRIPAEAEEILARRPVEATASQAPGEQMPLPVRNEQMPHLAPSERMPFASGEARLPVPAPVGAGEITITQRLEIAAVQADRGRASSERPASPARRRAEHTLVLIGELDRGSTHTLEAEIERLCEAGIAAITLDLTKLSGIDSAGVAVIAFRSSWCRRRGHELVLVPGPRAVQRAFELAGVVHTLKFTDEQAGVEM